MAEASTSTMSIANTQMSTQWLPRRRALFFKSVLQLGGPSRATPQAVLQRMNVAAIDAGEVPLTTDDIARHLFVSDHKAKIPKPWPPHLHCKFVDAVLELGGVDRASVYAVRAAMNANNSDRNDTGVTSSFEVSHRLLNFRSSFKKFEEGGLGFPSRTFLKLLDPNPEIENQSSYGALHRKVCSVRSRSTPYRKPPTASPPPPPPPRRFRWTLYYHRQFVEAVEELGGVEMAVPEEILKRMKAEETEQLTVEKIARHLQGLKEILEGEEKLLAKKNHGSHGYGPFKSLVNDLGKLSLALEDEIAFSP